MRVVLADDSVLLREGVVRLLTEAGFEVVGQAGDADDLLQQVAIPQPDVAIVDIRMPPETDGGLRAAREIRLAHPGVGVLVLSQYARPSYAFELLSDSAERVGYCSRTGSPTWRPLPTPSAASVPAVRCSIRWSSPSWSGDHGRVTTRSRT